MTAPPPPRTVLVTGASGGIGAAIVAGFAREGDHVLAPRRAELDLADPASIDRYVTRLHAAPDVLVNSAGINAEDAAGTLAADRLATMLQVNLSGPLLLAGRVAARLQDESRPGWILNVVSVWGLAGRAQRIGYSASKAGLAGATRALAAELAPGGVLVNALAPGFVRTPLTVRLNPGDALDRLARRVPLGRLAEPQEIADWAVFLCSRRNRYMTGQTIVVDGGLTAVI